MAFDPNQPFEEVEEVGFDPNLPFELVEEPTGTSVEQEVSQLGPAFIESIGRPLENMGESFEAIGFTGVANALKDVINEPEGYISASQRFMEPKPDEAQFLGFAWQYTPRAAVEQVGQAIGAMGTRAVGAVAGGAVAGPAGAVAGGFAGPAIFGAAQVIGPVAKERAMNNGREVPNNEDLVAATLTAIGSGSLDAIGAKYLPGGEKATGKFFKRVASSFVGEGLLTEAPQSVIEQVGATAGTEKGLNINVKQAVGEGLIGGTSAAGLSAVVYPLTKKEEPDPKKKVIRTPEQAEELDIDGKSNEEAISLMGEPADQAQNERITKLKEIEAVIANNETLMTGLEPNAPERTQLDLENKEARKEADKLKTEISKSVGLSLPITTAEQQQIELAKQIAAPPTPTTPAPAVQEGAKRMNLQEISESAIAAFPDMTESEGGLLPLTRFTPDEQASLRKAGIVETATTSTGETYEGVNSEYLWQRRKQLQQERAAKKKQAAAPTVEAAPVEPAQPVTEAPVTEVTPTEEAPAPTIKQRALERKESERKDKENAPIKFTTQKGSQYSVGESGTIYRDKFDGKKFKADKIGFVSKDDADKIAELPKQYEGKAIRVIHEPNKVRFVTNHQLPTEKTVFEALASDIPQEGMYPIEGSNFVPHLGDVITSVSTPAASTPTAPVAEAPAIAPAPVAETPAVSTAPEVAPAQRDITKPEQMTPEEAGIKAAKSDIEIWKEKFPPERIAAEKAREGSSIAEKQIAYLEGQISSGEARSRGHIYQVENAAKEGKPVSASAVEAYNITLPEGYTKQGDLYVYQPTPAVSETITKPKLGEKGGVLIPSREDLIQAGQNIYEAGMEFGAWAKQMVQRFGDAVRQFLADVWEAVSGFPAKLEEMAGYLPGKGERGAVTFGRGEEPPKKPAEPAPVTPAEPAPEKPAEEKPTKPAEPKRREKIMGVEAGPLIETQDGIIAKTKDKLKTLFDPEVVNEANTSTAYRSIGILSGTNRDAARQYAESINALTAEGLGEDADASTEISMGAALFVNNLFEYAVKLAAKGDRKMLGLMVSNINKLPTGQMGASDAGRTLRARVELKARFLMMAQAEQDAFTNYVAEFIYGPNPTEAQIKSIQNAYSATQKVTQPTAEELTEEIAKVGEKTYTDLVSKINDDFTKAAEKTADARDAELKELSDEYNKIQDKAETEIEKLAEIQSDTPSFARRVVNEIRAIVSADLKQKPDMGRKAPWKSMLIAKLQNAGVNPANAETLADLVWRQHEINATSRELDSINKAIEKGPISEIIKQIKETPIEQQQAPDWRYKVMRDYLRKAGLSMAQAERVAKLMDISLQKRFTEAKEKAFTESIEKSAPWKSGDARSKRAFQQVIKAIRAGALDPSRNFLNDIAAANGWTGFTDSQYAKLIKLDSILSDPKSSDADKAEAHKAIQNIISNSKLPIRARDVIGQFYDAQALSGIPTITVNMVSPIGMAAKNALVQAASGVATFRPDQIDAAFRTLMDSIKSWVNTVAYSFKNNVTVYSNVEYLVNDEGLLKLYNRGREQFKKGKTPKDRADGVKNMMVGMWDYVRRILNALDYGAIASLQNQTVPKYALAAMQAKGMSSKDGTKMLNAMFEAKRNFYEQQIAAGVDKNKASVLADEFFVSSWRQALTDAKLPAQQVIDSAINDSMSAVGRTRASLDNFRDENTNLQDAGVTSLPALWLLQTMANAANKSDSQLIKIFARIIYGFAVVPARVFRETAWFSPYGYVRFAYDAIAKKKGLNSPYAQSFGNDLQYRQRINEATAGTLVMLGLASALVSSIDDEDDERPFKIVVTGNGPNRADDPQFYDSWIKNNTPNSVRIQFGKTKFTINTMRGFEAFAWPAMMLGAVDDWQIRRKMNRKQNEPVAVGDAAVVAGNVFSAALKRGPYAFAAKPLFESYGDRTVESLFKSLAFPVKTLIPGVGSSLARNFSDLLNEPIDRRTLDGALWANVPFIGPVVAPKALNAFGEPALAGEASDKLFKLGVPIVFKIGTDRDSVNIHNLVLKQGSGPSIPTRNQLAKRLDREPTNKEYELFVKEYGSFISEQMKKRYKRYDEMKPEKYDKAIQKLSDVARDRAERVVRRQKNP